MVDEEVIREAIALAQAAQDSGAVARTVDPLLLAVICYEAIAQTNQTSKKNEQDA